MAVTAHVALNQDGLVLMSHQSVRSASMVSLRAQRHAMTIMATMEMAVIAHVVLKQNGHALVIHQYARDVEMDSSMGQRAAMTTI